MSSAELTSPSLSLKRGTCMDLAFQTTTSLVNCFSFNPEGNMVAFCSLYLFLFFFYTGTQSTNTCFVPVKLSSFKNSTTSWVGFSGGQHHTLCLNSEGNLFTSLIVSLCSVSSAAASESCAPSVFLYDVLLPFLSTGKAYSLGRAEYGRLGLGKDAGEKSEPTVVPGISDVQVVACGASVSYAVTKQGENRFCTRLMEFLGVFFFIIILIETTCSYASLKCIVNNLKPFVNLCKC